MTNIQSTLDTPGHISHVRTHHLRHASTCRTCRPMEGKRSHTTHAHACVTCVSVQCTGRPHSLEYTHTHSYPYNICIACCLAAGLEHCANRAHTLTHERARAHTRRQRFCRTTGVGARRDAVERSRRAQAVPHRDQLDHLALRLRMCRSSLLSILHHPPAENSGHARSTSTSTNNNHILKEARRQQKTKKTPKRKFSVCVLCCTDAFK